MAGFIATEALPRNTAALTPTIEPLEQQLAPGFLEAIQRAAVVRHPKVVEVAPQLAGGGLPDFGEGTGVTLLAEPLVQGDQGATQPFLRGLTLQAQEPGATAAPGVGKPEEIEGGQA